MVRHVLPADPSIGCRSQDGGAGEVDAQQPGQLGGGERGVERGRAPSRTDNWDGGGGEMLCLLHILGHDASARTRADDSANVHSKFLSALMGEGGSQQSPTSSDRSNYHRCHHRNRNGGGQCGYGRRCSRILGRWGLTGG